jgi:hypothetical protein
MKPEITTASGLPFVGRNVMQGAMDANGQLVPLRDPCGDPVRFQLQMIDERTLSISPPVDNA